MWEFGAKYFKKVPFSLIFPPIWLFPGFKWALNFMQYHCVVDKENYLLNEKAQISPTFQCYSINKIFVIAVTWKFCRPFDPLSVQQFLPPKLSIFYFSPKKRQKTDKFYTKKPILYITSTPFYWLPFLCCCCFCHKLYFLLFDVLMRHKYRRFSSKKLLKRVFLSFVKRLFILRVSMLSLIWALQTKDARARDVTH